MPAHVKIKKEEILSQFKYTLKKVTFDYQKRGEWKTQTREVYNRGDSASILLYNKKKKTVILTRQFRLPTFMSGNPGGMMVEACAGMLDSDNPEAAIKRETEEETGYRLKEVRQIFEAYLSPAAVTELLYFFVAEYQDEEKVSEGGGLEEEDIEVLELPFEQALSWVASGEIKDAKTILLLYHAKVQQLFAE